MTLSRRQMLWSGFGIVAVAGLGIFGIGRIVTEDELVSVLRRRLNFLHLDDAGLHAFAKDQIRVILAKRPTWNRIKYHLVSAVGPSFKRFGRSEDRRSRVQRIEDNFAATYLLSSDFFTNGANGTRLVRYVAFYDPMRACGDPFARSSLVPAHYP